MPINLLYVIQNIEFGGGERGFSQLINGIDTGTFRIFVATTPQGRFYQKVKEAGAETIPILFGRIKMIQTIHLLKKIIKKRNIQIVHSQGAWADFLARIVSHLVKELAVVSTIQMPVEGFDVSSFRKAIYKKLDRHEGSNI